MIEKSQKSTNDTTQTQKLLVHYTLTVNGICLFDSLIASLGGGRFHPPPEISGSAKGMTMNLLSDVGVHQET